MYVVCVSFVYILAPFVCRCRMALFRLGVRSLCRVSDPVVPVTFFSRVKGGFQWLRTTAKEKGKPFIAWYCLLYVGGLAGSYGAVRVYDGVEPQTVKEWAYKLHLNKIVDIEKIDLNKQNCEYLAAVLVNEAFDTPRLVLAVLTVDRVILIGKKFLKK